ncbi:MAG TPA: tRNA lysidine(34) synthetase TilS, partial [Gammaproteobacteria bacterium]|nr:tRNA lysidine(34) synthetase TilS [Gammaproteobacteria bacterium]
MFDPDYFKEIDFTKYKRIAVAYSGGVDSLVLLHAFSLIPECKQKLFALHVNHGLSQNSSTWQNHCEQICASLGVNFVVLEIEFSQKKGVSENDMREARYKALLSWTKKEDVLCTGHHKDDHVETIFFRLMRGTGIKGLSGIEQFSQMSGINLV